MQLMQSCGHACTLQIDLRQAKNHEAVQRAREIRLRAESRIGVLLKEQAQTGERATRGGDRGNQHTGGKVASSDNATLSDLNISRDQSSKWQKMGQFEQEDPEGFEQAIASPGQKVKSSYRYGRKIVVPHDHFHPPLWQEMS